MFLIANLTVWPFPAFVHRRCASAGFISLNFFENAVSKKEKKRGKRLPSVSFIRQPGTNNWRRFMWTRSRNQFSK